MFLLSRYSWPVVQVADSELDVQEVGLKGKFAILTEGVSMHLIYASTAALLCRWFLQQILLSIVVWRAVGG